MTVFNIGDEVTALDDRTATITYGPFRSTFDRDEMYVAKDGAGRERAYKTTDLKAKPAFKVGDTVEYEYGSGGKLVAGPFKSGYHDQAIWVVEKADGTHMTPTQNSLTKVEPADAIKVGDRVRVLKDNANCADVKAGDVFTVAGLETHLSPGVRTTEVPGRAGGWFFSMTAVEKVTEPAANTYTHDGMTYDLDAQYRDKDGDVWFFDGQTHRDGSPVIACDGCGFDSIDEAVCYYGPLTKI